MSSAPTPSAPPEVERTLELLYQCGATSGLHLDVGAGLAAHASRLEALGLTYVALESDEERLGELRARGLEAHAAALGTPEQLVRTVAQLRRDRPLASLSLVGALERLPDEERLLRALSSAAQGLMVPLIVDVANVASSVRAINLLLGRWDGPAARHTLAGLQAMTSAAGWREIAQRDQPVAAPGSQSTETAQSAHSLLGQLLRGIAETSHGQGGIERFVRAYLPVPPLPAAVQAETARPFLSVIMRTQGKREGTLRDALLALTAQSSQEFELLLLPHKVEPARLKLVEQILGEQVESLRARTRLIPVEHGGRTAPINVGFAAARGHYITVLDDDDIPLAHWVETFQRAAAKGMGTLLRTVAIEQEIEQVDWPGGATGFRTVGPWKKAYPSDYDLLLHLTQNYTPPMALSFPSAFFHELGERLNEELNTCEDWDYEMRCALRCGVTALPEITGVYRKWKVGESSQTLHSQAEWRADHLKIQAGFNSRPQLLPVGAIDAIIEMQERVRRLAAELAHHSDPSGLARALAMPVPPPGVLDRPLRYDVVDGLNLVFKRLPVVHPLLKASIKKLRR